MIRCDLDNDCTDGSDEEGCADHTCPAGKRQCDSGLLFQMIN